MCREFFIENHQGFVYFKLENIESHVSKAQSTSIELTKAIMRVESQLNGYKSLLKVAS